MPNDYPRVRSKDILEVAFPLNVRSYRMTITVFQNEHKFAQEPVLVQQYLCTPLKFPTKLSALFLWYN